jgi:hypothetical protein
MQSNNKPYILNISLYLYKNTLNSFFISALTAPNIGWHNITASATREQPTFMIIVMSVTFEVLIYCNSNKLINTAVRYRETRKLLNK